MSFVCGRHAVATTLRWILFLAATLDAIHMRDIVPSSGRHGVQIATLSGVVLSTSLVRILAFPNHTIFGGWKKRCAFSDAGRIQVEFRSLCYRLHLPRSYRKGYETSSFARTRGTLYLTETQRSLFPQLLSNPSMMYFRFFGYFYCRPLYGCSIDIDRVHKEEIPSRWDRAFHEQKSLH